MIHLLELLVEAVVLRLVLGDVKIRMVLFGHVVVTESNLLLVGAAFDAQNLIVILFRVKTCLARRG